MAVPWSLKWINESSTPRARRDWRLQNRQLPERRSESRLYCLDSPFARKLYTPLEAVEHRILLYEQGVFHFHVSEWESKTLLVSLHRGSRSLLAFYTYLRSLLLALGGHNSCWHLDLVENETGNYVIQYFKRFIESISIGLLSLFRWSYLFLICFVGPLLRCPRK